MSKLLGVWMLIGMVLGGCATLNHDAVNDYANFYKPEAGAADALAARAAPPSGSPQVVSVSTWDANIASAYARKGYVLIGASGFTSGRPEPDQDAISLGTELGADLVVILSPEYKGSVTASVPITMPNTTTSQSSGTATAYGSGAPVMAFGNSTTTTYGTSTTYVPVTVHRSAYAAGYFVKRFYRFGARFSDLTDSERQQLQTNRGAHVDFVVDNTPAYNSDILPGDVIIGLDGQAPNGFAGLLDLINANRGRTVEVTLVRAGRRLSKQVSILD